jgi:hypothetical protein
MNVSTRYQLDPRRLIIAVCEVNKVDAPLELVEMTAKELALTKEYITEPKAYPTVYLDSSEQD